MWRAEKAAALLGSAVVRVHHKLLLACDLASKLQMGLSDAGPTFKSTGAVSALGSFVAACNTASRSECKCAHVKRIRGLCITVCDKGRPRTRPLAKPERLESAEHTAFDLWAAV